jgi:Abnormal spindle-like microcephaly-assoc'd, ASPM-SPD-2-Hydin
VKTNLALILVGGLYLLSGCGGGSLAPPQSPPPPNILLAPSGLDFGVWVVGTKSGQQLERLTNNGASELVINSVVIIGANASDFAESDTCGSSLGAGANCSISVTFAPGATGNLTATLSVTDSSSGSPQNAALSGTGNAAPHGTLIGACIHEGSGPPPGCRSTSDSADCPPGQVAKQPGYISCGGDQSPTYVDGAARCLVGGRSSGGYCEVNP